MRKNTNLTIVAALFAVSAPAIGYISFGIIPAVLFLIGYMEVPADIKVIMSPYYNPQ